MQFRIHLAARAARPIFARPIAVRPTLLIVVLLALAGCNTLTKSQCRSTNWTQLGYHDAMVGFPVSRLQKHQKACMKADITADDVAYKNGYKVGARIYCKPQSAFSKGRDGMPYFGICTDRQEEIFLPVYRVGQKQHNLKRDIRSIQDSIHTLETKVREIKDDKRAGKIDEQTSRSLTRDLENETDRWRRDLTDAEQELIRFNNRLLSLGYLRMALGNGALYRRALDSQTAQ